MRLVHRVTTSAPPAVVWQVLGDPRQWAQLDPLLRGARGHARVSTGTHLMVPLRVAPVEIPVDVVEAVPEQRLVLLVHLAPGLRERVSFDLTPARRGGGSDLAVATEVEGVLAAGAVLPLWLWDGFMLRVFAARAARTAKAARRGAA